MKLKQGRSSLEWKRRERLRKLTRDKEKRMLAQSGNPVDWVGRRASCTTLEIFEFLRKQFDDDVMTMNGYSQATRRDYCFRLLGACPFITVRRESPTTMSGKEELIEMTIRGDRIAIKPFKMPEFEVCHKWDDKTATCSLYVDDEQYEVWQISQRTLVDLFFN